MDEVTNRSAARPAASTAEDKPKQKTRDAGTAIEAAPQLEETDGFHLVIDALKLNGIDTIFGLPGIPITDFTRKAQAMAYEEHRAMFEAYARNKYRSTGVIQWMLNNAWPSLIWHLYDWYLRPAGGYYGTKTACRPLHAQYSYDDRSVAVVEDRHQPAQGLKVTATVLDADLKPRFTRTETVDVPADGVVRVMTLPDLADLSTTYFVRLELRDAGGQDLGSNFYWLSTKPETIDWPKSTWFTTPTESYADYTALSQLPKVKLKVSDRSEHRLDQEITHVTLENPSKNLAFFVRLKVNKGAKGEEILPVIWEDNYISLLPGEKREVRAVFRASELGAAKPVVEVSGWNVE